MKELDDNLLNQLVQSIMDSRKEPKREPATAEIDLPDDIKELEDLKRARYEALKEKYKD
jgi:hypothetical protein